MKPFVLIRPVMAAFLVALYAETAVRAETQLVDELSIGVKNPLKVSLGKPPRGFVADTKLGLLRHRAFLWPSLLL